jgi:uncharacterized protein YlxW (UPF0749 family)
MSAPDTGLPGGGGERRDAEQPRTEQPRTDQPAPVPEVAEVPEVPEPEVAGPAPGGAPAGQRAAPRRRRRDRTAAVLIGVLTLLLGFALAVQVRNSNGSDQLSTSREEDLVGILDDVSGQQEQLRQQIAEQRQALDGLTTNGDSAGAALSEARRRADALGILNGTVAAQGPGIVMTISDPDGQVRVQDVLDVLQELRNAGAETMQVDGVRVGVSTAVTGTPGNLSLDGTSVRAPYEVRAIGSPPDLETAMGIPGGVVSTVQSRGGAVTVQQSQQVVVDALRPLQQARYAQPGG